MFESSYYLLIKKGGKLFKCIFLSLNNSPTLAGILGQGCPRPRSPWLLSWLSKKLTENYHFPQINFHTSGVINTFKILKNVDSVGNQALGNINNQQHIYVTLLTSIFIITILILYIFVYPRKWHLFVILVNTIQSLLFHFLNFAIE